MSEDLAYLIGVGLALTVTMAVCGYLRNLMRTNFEKFCGEPDLARFWCRFCQVIMVLMTLIVGYLGRTMAVPGIPLFVPVVHYFTSGVIGLLIAMTTIGIVVSIIQHPISEQNSGRYSHAAPSPESAMLLKLRKRVAKVRTKERQARQATRPHSGG